MKSASSLPDVFCWTKMGAEAGQPLEHILRRKELERRAGEGTFAWGIGNSLGSAPAKARGVVRGTELEVLFTAMKSPPRPADRDSSQLLMWLSYIGDAGRVEPLPLHALVTSRGGPRKRSHYALLCRRGTAIDRDGEDGVLDAACARNLLTQNPVGASQVTSVVLYRHDCRTKQAQLYKVSFRAELSGFVRLAAPVPLDGRLLDLYEQACHESTVEGWRSSVSALRGAALEELERTCSLPV